MENTNRLPSSPPALDPLTSYQKSAFCGTLLGDAYIWRKKRKKMESMMVFFEQKESSKDYVVHLHFLFRMFIHKTKPDFIIRPAEITSDGKVRKEKRCYLSNTCTHYVWTSYEYLFYRKFIPGENRKKRIPLNIAEFLDPISLAYWYGDDGSREKDGIHLNTQRYPYLEQVRLCEALYKNFGFTMSIHKSGKSKAGEIQWKIYIWKRSKDEFCRIVSPYLHPVFSYKLDHPFIGPQIPEWFGKAPKEHRRGRKSCLLTPWEKSEIELSRAFAWELEKKRPKFLRCPVTFEFLFKTKTTKKKGKK